jgi:hypothetical protein
LLKSLWVVDSVYHCLEVPTDLSLCPWLTLQYLLQLFLLFSFELCEEAFLVFLADIEYIDSDYLIVLLEVFSECLHEQVHLLKILCAGLLLTHLLVYAFPVLLQFSDQEVLDFQASVCEFIHLVFDLLFLRLCYVGSLFLCNILAPCL